jgi:hypothetical protein
MAFKLSKTAFFLFLSLLASLVYFLPTTAHPTHNLSNFSLFAFGDMGALYDPSLVYLSFNLHHYNVLSGIDWLTSGGSSIFYARSNFGIFYPVKLFVAYFFSIDSLQKAALANAGIYYFEFAFGFFFTILTGFQARWRLPWNSGLFLLYRQDFPFSFIAFFVAPRGYAFWA